MTPDRVLELARGELGYVEGPNNDTIYGRWYGINNAPWCAMFVSFVFFHADLPLPASTSKGFAYTPTWTGVTTNPAIGNGTIKGAYKVVGKTLHFRITIVMGSTTTYGSGLWRLGLPTGIVARTDASVRQSGINAWMFDSSAGTQYVGLARADSGATTVFPIIAASNTVSFVQSNVPFTWASGDELQVSGTIEID